MSSPKSRQTKSGAVKKSSDVEAKGAPEQVKRPWTKILLSAAVASMVATWSYQMTSDYLSRDSQMKTAVESLYDPVSTQQTVDETRAAFSRLPLSQDPYFISDTYLEFVKASADLDLASLDAEKDSGNGVFERVLTGDLLEQYQDQAGAYREAVPGLAEAASLNLTVQTLEALCADADVTAVHAPSKPEVLTVFGYTPELDAAGRSYRAALIKHVEALRGLVSTYC